MRFFYLLALFCVLMLRAVPGYSQSISLFDLDTSAYPLMKGKFYAFDGSGAQVSPAAADLTLTDNGIAQTILSVSCPPATVPRALSSVLVIDVSGSMALGMGSVPNIDLAKAAARAWVNALPLGASECAITSFDHLNYLNHDFTIDRGKLLNAIAFLAPGGGTNYDQGLLLPPAGGLQIAKPGKHQKVIIFLTDGQPQLPPNTAAIIAEAKRQNCIVYAVTLGMPCPPSLREISTQTGGNWFEMVTTVEQAEHVYRQILYQARSSSPCEITWQSPPCAAGVHSVELGWSGQVAKNAYTVPDRGIMELQFSPVSIFIPSKPVGVPFDTVVSVTAVNSAFNVTGITSSNPAYQIIPASFTLAAGASRNVTVRYTPPDSGFTWTEFTIQTDLCPQLYYASGGFIGKPPKTPTLKLDHPNGGEVFVAGSDTVITWSGLPATDNVKLEYSIDNGALWKSVTAKTSGGRYEWHVPNTPSDRCLARVRRLKGWGDPDATGLMWTLRGHTSQVRDAAWSPDGSRVATGSADFNAMVWDAAAGTLIRAYVGHGAPVLDVAWSPDGSRMITAGQDFNAVIWNTTNGARLHTLSGAVAPIMQVDWSSDGTRVASVSLDGTARIWNPANGTLVHSLTGHIDAPIVVRFSPDGKRVATSTFLGEVKIFDVTTGRLIRDLIGHVDRVISLDWSRDGRRLASAGFDNSVRIWDANTGAVLQNLSHPAPATSVHWSPDGTRLATGSLDNNVRIWTAATGGLAQVCTGHTDWVVWVRWSPTGTRVASASLDGAANVWNGTNGTLVRSLLGHIGAINTVEWSPDGTRLATSSDDGTAKIWSVDETPELEDISDAVFSIVLPTPASNDVDMGKVVVGSVKDSIVTAFIRNTGTYPFRVDSIKIIGSSATQFSVVSGIPPFKVDPGDAYPVEFRFSPASRGTKTGQIRIYTQAIALTQNIRGEGVDVALDVLGDVIDFGRIPVGLQKDTLRAVTIKNVGTAPLEITATRHAGPNDKDFTTLAGGGAFTLQPGDTARLDLRFAASAEGRTSGQLLFDHNGPGSPATVQLFGEGTLETAPMVVILTDTIDFGAVEVGASRDTLRAVTIMNRGTAPLTVTGTRHGGLNATEFATVAGGGAFTLQPGDTARLDLRFSPSAVGALQGQLLFDHVAAGSPSIVYLLGQGLADIDLPLLEILNDTIDFGEVQLGSSRDTLRAVTIMNRGTAPLIITGTRHAGLNATEFATVAGGGAFTLFPGDTARLDLRFTPSAIGSLYGELLFDHAGPASPAIVQLLGVGADLSLATIEAGSAEAEPGALVEIPIRLKNASRVAASGATRFTARLRFNATLLEPVESTPSGTLQGEDRIIDLDLPTEPDAQGILTMLRFRAGLGTDSITTLLLEEPRSVGGIVVMGVEHGEFRLLGICEAGGARLVNPNGVITLKAVRPNPITGAVANVELETTEIGETHLFLTDMLGRTIKTLVQGELTPGRRIYQFDLEDLPTGPYFMTLQTPTERRTIRVEVVR